jgi:hypothetical protein
MKFTHTSLTAFSHANMQRLEHEYTATNISDTPTLEQLESAVKQSDQWYLEYVSKLATSALSESIDFTLTDGALAVCDVPPG